MNSIDLVLKVVLATTLNGLASLGGGLIPSPFLHRHMGSVLAAASGVLLGTAFLDLLPEALEAGSSAAVMAACLGGFLSFFFVDVAFGSHATGQTAHRHDKAGPLILVGDALHNISDGVAIAAAFVADERLGWITTATVILHELPQEIADYAILIARGWSKASALAALFAVQLTGVAGALGALWLAGPTMNLMPALLAFSAGGFIYVAAADLMPQIRRRSDDSAAWVRVLLFLTGVAVMAFITAGHTHGHGHPH